MLITFLKDLIQDEVGCNGFGGRPLSWQPISLSECCPSLETLTFIMHSMNVAPQSQSTPIFEWRYALRLLSFAPRSLKSIKIGVVRSWPFSLWVSMLQAVNWPQWRQVLQEFKQARLTFMPMDPNVGEGLTYFKPFTRRMPRCSSSWAEWAKFLKSKVPPSISQ